MSFNLFFCVFKAEEYVPLPKGDVHKKKEIVQDVTLHDLDVANARPQVCHFIPLPYFLDNRPTFESKPIRKEFLSILSAYASPTDCSYFFEANFAMKMLVYLSLSVNIRSCLDF